MSTISEPTPLMRYFDEYQSHHHNRWNELTHIVGIPAIFFAILGLLSRVGLPTTFLAGAFALDLGLAAWLASSAFYIWLDRRLGFSFSLMTLGFYVLGRQVMFSQFWWALWVLFVAGWIVQFVGHYQFEKRSPAFFQNLMHLLVGPYWIFAKAVGFYRN